VRTPWTLASDLAWERTHRLAGKLFLLFGVWALIAAFVAPNDVLTPALAWPAGAIVVVCIVHSYLVWRRDPGRQRSAEHV
jgi:uncharacterized membrane protein